MKTIIMRVAIAVCLVVIGLVHEELYVDNGYRAIHVVGPSFLVASAGAFAVAALLLVGDALIVRLLAAGLAAGALVGFVASRTIGIAGFIETGLQPAPQALLSILAEVAVLVLVAVPFAVRFIRWMLLAAPANS
jgi:hypothetical protein